VLAQVYGAGPAEVDQAVKVVAADQRSWARRAPVERGAALRLMHAVTGDVRNRGPTMDVTEHHPFGVVASIIPFNWPPIHTAGKAAR
jgi:acyl-CoA reductase-like NAD-dependent aldehyde dehydrogenase